MIIESSIAGCLPRPPGLISATREFDRNRISEKELEESFRTYTEEVIRAQRDSGLTYINDGFLRRQDLLRPFTSKLRGVEEGQLCRWFDNNTFYKKPIIMDKISGEPPFNETYLEFLPESRLKAVLPAPYTFVKLSNDEFYGDEERFLNDVATVLNEEIKALEGQGYEYIQLSDPALVYPKTAPRKETLRKIREALNITTDGVNARTCLQTFFGDITRVLDEVIGWPIDDIGVDCYTSKAEALKEYSFEGLSLGIVDARNTLTEDPDELVDIYLDQIQASTPEKVIISTNCDLDYLTWEEAQSKIKTVTTVAMKLKEELE